MVIFVDFVFSFDRKELEMVLKSFHVMTRL